MSDPAEQSGSTNGGVSPEGFGGGPAAAISGLAAGRVEVVVGAAFAGGLVLAILARRLAR